MPRESEEVAIEVADVDAHVRDGLGGVDEDEGSTLVRYGRKCLDVVDRAQDVRCLGQRDEAGPRVPFALDPREVEAAVRLDSGYEDSTATALRRQLPGDDIAVVLHLGEEDGIALGKVRVSPGRGDEVDRLGGPARENDLGVLLRSYESPDFGTGFLEGRRRFLAEGVDGAVDVGVAARVKARAGLDDGDGLLGGRRVVEVGELAAAEGSRRRGSGPEIDAS